MKKVVKYSIEKLFILVDVTAAQLKRIQQVQVVRKVVRKTPLSSPIDTHHIRGNIDLKGS